MADGSNEPGIEAHTAAMQTAPGQGEPPAPRRWALPLLGGVFGPLGAMLARLRDFAAATPESLAEASDERPYLDTIAFREVLPLLEERHLMLSEIKELGRRTDDAEPGRLASLQRQHEESIPAFLEHLEKATMCVHSRRHHAIRDMLENVVLYDNFLNDFYLRNVCSTMREAIEAITREYR